ncbi:MAG: adenylate cyclase [Sneathiella sp.]|uniref:adenylate/guanylate cyclase domain-containing protein n=1 Tax=Sneathiella sp. TaxID=1964365 RepID=UPI000C368286|nr:adenylate/guanylate cyclase domain-containing protein [Sneathiella sp.]MAZ02657.1 adenylate cyclase [Sneathiella sp.]
MNSGTDRKLTTILCADVAGYSRLMNKNEGETLSRLKATREIFSDFIIRYNGRTVNMTGDGLVCEFPSVVNAVQCAVEVQNKINEDNLSLLPADRMLYRIGINLGDVLIEGDDIFGEGVNVAARLEALAPVGGICISGSVFDQVKNKLPKHFEFLGNKTVKNIADPVPVYSLVLAEMSDVYTDASASRLNSENAPKEETEDDRKIRAYVKRQAAFYRRATAFGAITLMLFFINMATSPDYWWFLWPAAGFVVSLIIQGIMIFKGPRHGKEWEERKINELKARRHKPHS